LNNKNSILFSGDSYTWGEGLQLYIENDFWISERNQHNEWSSLQKKLTIESEIFREQNRFAGLVSNYFDCKQIVRPLNGGQFEYPINFVEKIIKERTNKIKFLIFQFTGLERSNLHLKDDCNCEFCITSEMNKPHFFLLELIEKKLNNILFSEKDKILIEYLKKHYNINIFELLEAEEEIFYSNVFDQFYSKYFYQNVEIFIKDYLINWNKYFPIYFIDSWSENSSKVLLSYEEIYNNTIPLIGFDNKLYKDWNSFVNTFEHQMIKDEFPLTRNHHPTFIQHQHISKSIITHIENNFIETEKKFI